MRVGDLVGEGRTSDVFAYGDDCVIKVPHADVPPAWPPFEARLTEAVRSCGVPAPQVHDVIDFEGRSSIVFERINGPSMWQQMCDQPAQANALAQQLAAIQKDLFATGIPTGVPDLVDRLCRKISVAPGLSEIERTEGTQLAETLPRGAALLHGDLHPGNILMSESGPVIIDWFDATIGHPVADIVRSSILLRPSRHAAPYHLPNASAATLEQIHQVYLGEFDEQLSWVGQLDGWYAVLAAGRLAEGAEVNESGLLDLWHARGLEE